MPEAEEFVLMLDESEVRIDITRSSGCGGQGVILQIVQLD